MAAESLPPWERGLKPQLRDVVVFDDVVAPPVGAWIETSLSIIFKSFDVVAPPVGAWIET